MEDSGKPKENPLPVKKSQLEKDAVYRQSNPLIFGRQKLGMRELKILKMIFTQLEDGKRFKMEFRMDDVASDLGFTSSNSRYEDIKEVLKSLKDSSFWLMQADGSEINLSWITRPTTRKKDMTFTVQIEPELMPYLVELYKSGHYTQIGYEPVVGMRSVYSIRLFEMIMSQKFKSKDGFWTLNLSIDQMRKSFDWGKKEYKQPSHIKDRVVIPAVEEIKKWTNLDVAWEADKPSRQIVGYIFRCCEKSSMKLVQKSEEQMRSEDIEALLKLAPLKLRGQIEDEIIQGIRDMARDGELFEEMRDLKETAIRARILEAHRKELEGLAGS